MKQILILILLVASVFIFSCRNNLAARNASMIAAMEASPQINKDSNEDSRTQKMGGLIGGAKVGKASDTAKSAPLGFIPEGNSTIAAGDSTAEIKQPIDRKIIRNGDFTIESKNPSDDQRKIASIAESLGGFVVTSEFKQAASSDASGSSVNVIVRVPSAQFDKAINEIIKTGSQIIYQKTSGKDVTEEFVDLEARLRAKHALENQYLEIMKRASKISDVLEVQEKLTDVRTEIERMEGRRRYLDNQASLSTINITLQSPAAIVAATQNGFWRSIKNSFGDGVDEAVGIVLSVIHFVIVALPVFVLVILPLWFVLRLLNRRYNFLKRWKKEIVGTTPEA